MPTAGRLAGAIIFGLFGWYMAGISVPFFPFEAAPNLWIEACIAASVFVGWRICGVRSGRGYRAAIGIGLTTAAVMAFVAVFGLSFSQMIANSMRMRYGGPMEGIVDIFRLMMDFGVYFYDTNLIMTLLIGGIICAWATEFFSRRYP